jgi:hypothetical protein
MIEWSLKIGNKVQDVVVRQDAKYPQMWRLHRGGKISDMVNLTRAKDAALGIARPRGLGGKETICWNSREIDVRRGL